MMKIIKGLLIVFALSLIISCSEKRENDMKTNDQKNDNSKVEIIAHRGGSKLAPENTLAAYKNAIKLGVDMIEIDVHLSKDGKIIVIHDEKIDRTTNGKGTVKDMTLAEIRKYDAGGWFDEKFKGEKIPTLDEVMETLNGKVKLLIEIKDGDELYPGLEKKVVETIHKYNAVDWVIVQSFNENSVLRVRKMDPSITTFYLLGRNFGDFYSNVAKEVNAGDAVIKKYDGIAPHYSMLDSEKVKIFHKAGFKVFTWTVDKPEDMKKIINMNVDGIITNSPDKLKEILNK
ncbi:MAG: glycerophosphodiester phosphodiesterase [Chlorobi bacterium]|nr:glycerophosphodiester phosphodiesterase [Chlorobiota bacterium]